MRNSRITDDGDAGGVGMKIEIDIDEYFTPEMIKEIAEDELRRAFRRIRHLESAIVQSVAAPLQTRPWTW